MSTVLEQQSVPISVSNLLFKITHYISSTVLWFIHKKLNDWTGIELSGSSQINNKNLLERYRVGYACTTLPNILTTKNTLIVQNNTNTNGLSLSG